MADTKISDLTALTGANVADDDEFVIVDTSAAQSKRITRAELANGGFTSLNVTGTITADGLTVDGVGTAIDLRSNNTSGTAQNALRFTDLDLSASANQQLGKIEFYSSDVSTPGAGVKAEISGVAEVGNPGAALIFKTDAQTGTPIDRVRINRFGDISFYDSTGTSQNLFWDASASALGIGTTSPSSILHLSSSGTTVRTIAESTNAAGYVGYRATNGTGYWEMQVDGANQGLRWLDDGTERMRIDSSGNVGIGVSSPADKLSVNGNIKTTVDNTIIAPYGSLLGFVKKGGSAGSIAYASGQSLIFSQSSASSLSDASSETYSERMRIDSSGNLLVGKTSQSVDNVGGEILSTGIGQFTVNGNFAARFTRQTSDGDIVVFRKGTGVVGSIGAASGSTYYTTYASGVTGSGIIGGDGNVLLANKNGASTDGSVDLGASNKRVRNLYLSGGVYLGGTGSANLLDDYEEGTWTPIWECSTSNPTVTYSAQVGRYTKIGNIVYVKLRLTVTSVSGGSGNLLITGLPFTATNDSGALGTATIGYKVNFTGNGPDYGRLINSQIELYYDNNTNEVALTQANLTSSVDCIFAAVYTTTQ